MFSPDQALGEIGELWAYEKLVSLGWPVVRMPLFGHRAYDMEIGPLPIEVKYARVTYRRQQRQGENVNIDRWQWYIHTTTTKLLADRDWVLILIAEDRKGDKYPYVLPGNLLDGRRHLQLTSHPKMYRGWLNDWRDQWDVITFLTQKTYLENGPTYHQWKVGQRILVG